VTTVPPSPITFIRELHLIEAEATERQLDANTRLALRTARSLPWLTRLEKWIDGHARTLLPTSKLGEACSYALQQRPFIQRCFTNGRFEIDNGKVERAIREPAIFVSLCTLSRSTWNHKRAIIGSIATRASCAFAAAA
jgi:hypothetical protein